MADCFQVLELIEAQTKTLDQRIDALLLVGGFAGCEYLKQRVEVRVAKLFESVSSTTGDPTRNNLHPESKSLKGPPMLTLRPFVVRHNMV
jgi:butyrate kinase